MHSFAQTLSWAMENAGLEITSMIFDCEAAYLHIPFCRRRCFYCDFPITVVGNADLHQSNWVENYVNTLCLEIQATPRQGQRLTSIFFGGGTPSLLPVQNLAQILTSLDHQFGIDAQAEISLEIDPATFTFSQLQAYQFLGVNRLSLGVQAFQDDLLQKCGRFHREKDIEQAIAWIHQLGFKNWSLDLISGLPEQTLDHWQASLAQAIDCQPSHLSCYDLVLEPVTVFGKQLVAGEKPLPGDEQTAQMYRLASQLLRQAGYDHYEISNYGRSGYQCLHNRVYWENRSYYGFGLGAASYTQGVRFTRPRTRQSYTDWVTNYRRSPGEILGEPVSAIDHLLESLMLGLRLREGVILETLPRMNAHWLTQILAILQPFVHQGWVNQQPVNYPQEPHVIHTQIHLTDPDGFLFSNQVLTAIFTELEDTL